MPRPLPDYVFNARKLKEWQVFASLLVKGKTHKLVSQVFFTEILIRLYAESNRILRKITLFHGQCHQLKAKS